MIFFKFKLNFILGYINTNPSFHSEHNLFPVGFKTVRIYNSMFNKGVKCEYTSEILEVYLKIINIIFNLITKNYIKMILNL